MLKLFRISLVIQLYAARFLTYLYNWEFLGLVWLTRVPIDNCLSCGFPNLFLSCMCGDEWLVLLLNSLRQDSLSTR